MYQCSFSIQRFQSMFINNTINMVQAKYAFSLFFQCLHIHTSLLTVIDFPSFLPPLVTVGRLGSDSGQLLLGGRREARRDDTTRHTRHQVSLPAAMKTSLAFGYVFIRS